jgi:cell division septation protein DedD
MKPVELKPERDTSFPEAEEEDDLEDFDFLSDIAGDDSDVYAGTEEEQDIFAEDVKPAEKKKEVKSSPLKSPRMQAKKRSGSLLWVFAAIVGVAVLVLAYLYFIGSLVTNTQEVSPAVTQVDPEPQNSMEDNEQPESVGESTDDQQSNSEQNSEESDTQGTEIEIESSVEPPEEIIPSDPAEPAEETSVSNEDQPLYGLRGLVVEEANSGYSIVLHSFTEEENARSTSENLTRQGYRAIVSSRTVGEQTMWRVSVGQFETLQDAQQATRNLPEPYNTQNFIHRIQIN